MSHRWLSIAFTLVVIVNGVAVVERKYNNKLGLLAVFVLALQYFSGLYLFGLPYATKWQPARAPAQANLVAGRFIDDLDESGSCCWRGLGLEESGE